MYNVSSNIYHVFEKQVACVIHFCMLILTQHDHAFRVDFIKKSAKPASKMFPGAYSLQDIILIKQIWIDFRTQITSYHHKTKKKLTLFFTFLLIV